MNLADLERLLHVERSSPPRPTRKDADTMRRRKLAKPWRRMRARRKG